MKKIVLLPILILISSCTGSFEDSGTPVRVVVSVNPDLVKNIPCIGQQLAVSKSPNLVSPGLVLLDPNRFSSSVNQVNSCGAFFPLPGVPFDVVNGAETIVSPSVFVSIPSQSVVKQLTYLRSANNTVQDPNTLVQKLEFKYTPIDSKDDPNFCPTQLAISRDNLRLVVLDNPNFEKPNYNSANCSAARIPRIIIFNIADGSIFKRIDIAKTNLFIEASSKEISIAVLNNRLYVLGEFATRYKISSFNLLASDPNTDTITSDGSRLPPTFSSFPTNNPKVNLSIVQNGLLASLSNDDGGQVFPIVEDLTQRTIAFGDERLAGSLAADPPIGKVTTIRSNAFSSSISSNFTLYLRPNNILFQRNTQFAAQTISSPIDATFPADNTIWVLNTKRLFKVDTRDFPEKPQFDTGIDFTDLNPGNLVWVLDEN
jgi:hypothetical protein